MNKLFLFLFFCLFISTSFEAFATAAKHPLLTQMHVSVKAIIQGKGPDVDVKDVSMHFLYDQNGAFVESSPTGDFYIARTLNSKFGVIATEFFSNNFISTITDLSLESTNAPTEQIVQNVPLMSYELLQQFALGNYEQASFMVDASLSGHLLIELDNETKDVLIGERDVFEGRRFYLDENFYVLNDKQIKKRRYVFFVGVTPGNVNLRYILDDKQVVSKIIHIEPGKIYFDPNYYVNKDTLSLNISNVTKGFEKEKILLFNMNNRPVNKILKNTHYQYDDVILPLGTRALVEVKASGMETLPLFISLWDSKTIALPSTEHLSNVFNRLEIPQLNGHCFIEVSAGKEIKEIVYSGRSIDKTIPMTHFVEGNSAYLQGNLYSDDFALENGVVDIKVDYKDGTVDQLQSQCTDQIYYIEQL